MTIASLQKKRIPDLKQIAQDLGVVEFADLPKDDLIVRILEAYAETEPVGGSGRVEMSSSGYRGTHGDGQYNGHPAENQVEKGRAVGRLPAYMLGFNPKKVALEGIIHKVGVLEVIPDGYGFLRSPDYRYHPSADDIYVSPSQIKRFSLRAGDTVEGEIRPPREGQRFFALIRVGSINGRPPDAFGERTSFDYLSPSPTTKPYRLETTADVLAPRVLDLFCPIGIGHRCLVKSASQGGRNTLLRQIAGSLSTNHPSVHVLALLINEQSDHIVDFERYTQADVAATTFGDTPELHVHMATLVGEKVRRMVEAGHDVVLLIDSITKLAHAHHALALKGRSATTDVLDTNALRRPKALFGAAGAMEEGGSLTIVATMQLDTGREIDREIYQEFKGASNTTIVLSDDLARNGIYPAIDLHQSHTRRQEALVPVRDLESIRRLRRQLLEQEPKAAMKTLIERLQATRSNADLLASLSADG